MGGLLPLNTGGRRRTFQILSELTRRHDVTVFTTTEAGDDPPDDLPRLGACSRVVAVPYDVPKPGTSRFARALVRSWGSRYPVALWKWQVPDLRRRIRAAVTPNAVDVVVVDFLFADPNVPPAGVPTVYFAHNVECQIWKRLAAVEPRAWRRALLEIEWRKLRACERRTVRRANTTVAVSPQDRAMLLDDAPAARVEVVSTGVDTSYFAPTGAAEVPLRLVFSGSMDWYPNEDAILYFADRIWPRLRACRPGLSLTVVGRNPSTRLASVAREAGIDVTGTVDDVRPHIADASVYVVPIRIAGGTRLKIFEALAMQKAVVSTTVGAEGLGLASGHHFVAADGEDAFAAAVLRLLDDADARRALGTAGRQLVEEHYSWSSVSRQFESFLEGAVRPDVARASTEHCAPVSP